MDSQASQNAQATILVVDDTAQNLTVRGELLPPTYRVRAATSGWRALRIAAAEPRPDLVLLEVMMPDMDGYAVLARLRKDRRTRDIPLIFVTAMDAMEEAQHGLDFGAVDDITKPLRPPIVLARVRTQLGLKRARDGRKRATRRPATRCTAPRKEITSLLREGGK